MVDNKAEHKDQAEECIGIYRLPKQVEYKERQGKGYRNAQGSNQGVSYSDEQPEDDHQECQPHEGVA